jgi:hypothetical protein
MSKQVKSIGNAFKSVAKNPFNPKNYADVGLRTVTGGMVGTDTVAGAAGYAKKGSMGGGVDASGKPIRPGFQTLLGVDSKTGLYNRFSLPEELQAKEVAGQAGRDLLKSRALSTGRSDLANLQIERQGIEEAAALENIGKQGASQLEQARGNIARTGGMRSGVAAMLEGRNMNDQMMQKQMARRGGIEDRLSIDINDANQKNSLLQNLVGNDLSTSQYNIGNVLAEKRTKDTADMSAYAQDMQAWAAAKQGKAIAGSKPSGFLSFLGI